MLISERLRGKNLTDYLMIAIIVVIFFASLFEINLKIKGFLLESGDTSVAEQAIWNTIHGDWFYQSFLPVSNNFREHLNFSQFIFLPFYALVPKLLTIYVVIGLAYSAATFFLYQLAKEKLGGGLAFVAALSFLLNPIAILQNIHTMHVAAIGAPLLLMSFIFYEKNKYVPWLIFLIATVMASEFVAPTVFLIGIIAFIDKRSLKWIIPPIASSLAMYIASALYITVGFSENKTLLGSLNFASIQDSLNKRLYYLEEIFRPALYVMPFFSKYAILLLPTVALDMVILRYDRLASGSHLFSLVPAILAIIFVDILQKCNPKHKKFIAGLIVLGLAISVPSWYKEVSFSPDKRVSAMEEAIGLVKDSGSVTASRVLGPSLNHRHDFYLFDNAMDTDYVIINSKGEDARSRKLKPYLQSIYASDDYLKVMERDGVAAYVKKAKVAELTLRDASFVSENPEEAIKILKNK